MKHLINWVEIPTKDIKRAISFYSKILGINFFEMEISGTHYAIFPSEDKFNSGALVQGEFYKPSGEGTLVYLDGGEDMDFILSKVAGAGGTVVMKKTYFSPEAGNIGLFIDTEGNKIGLQHP